MRYLKYAVLIWVCMFLGASAAHAQVFVGVGPGYYGPPPNCVYGYYDYAPYACAPYGYYGPDYFVGGVFIGAGPWFRGYDRRGFFGRGWDGDRDGFRGERGWRGEGGWHGGGEFRGNQGFRGGNGFHG